MHLAGRLSLGYLLFVSISQGLQQDPLRDFAHDLTKITLPLFKHCTFWLQATGRFEKKHFYTIVWRNCVKKLCEVIVWRNCMKKCESKIVEHSDCHLYRREATPHVTQGQHARIQSDMLPQHSLRLAQPLNENCWHCCRELMFFKRCSKHFL